MIYNFDSLTQEDIEKIQQANMLAIAPIVNKMNLMREQQAKQQAELTKLLDFEPSEIWNIE